MHSVYKVCTKLNMQAHSLGLELLLLAVARSLLDGLLLGREWPLVLW